MIINNAYFETNHTYTFYEQQSNSQYNRRCIDGRITGCGNCVGYCQYKEHPVYFIRSVYIKDISTGKKATDFADAVKGLLGLNAMYSAIQHFNPKSKFGVIGSYESSYDSHSNSKIQEYTNTIERCKTEIAKIDEMLSNLSK